MLEPQTQWVSASPLWNGSTTQLRQPALLRFTSDSFMQELTTLLQTNPVSLGDFRATPTSYREIPTGEADDWTSTLDNLKLYQPAHGHFNLIAASLVCRIPGLPDRAIDLANNEKVSFVLRKVAAGGEYAWTTNSTQGNRWQFVANTQTAHLAAGEELLPMFPINFQLEDKRRRVLVGLVPTSSQQSFQGAPTDSTLIPAPNDPALANETPMLDELDARVIEPLNDLGAMQSPTAPDLLDPSHFILLDLADFLNTYAPSVWQAIYNENQPPANTDARSLYDLLAAPINIWTTWRHGMKNAWDEKDALTGGKSPSFSYNVRNTINPSTLRTRVASVLPAAPPTNSPASNTARPTVPQFAPDGSTLYVLRCVYQRPQCKPPRPEIVSAASEQFTIAPFFDFDAPARPIRISMPVDTSIAGLRKFRKNVSFLLSNQLRSQMERATDLQKALDGDLGAAQSFDLGMICSFSIPIITICALIVLMIFLVLLNFVFWWLPFFRICFPISLKAEG